MNERFLDYQGLEKYDQKIKQCISVTSVNGKTGTVTLSASDVSAVPTSRKVNGKALSGDISLTASDVSAVPASRTVNGKALTSDISISASDISAVPTSRTVNGKALTSDISISASDISAVPTSRKVNGKALSSDVSLTASDVGATGKTVPNGSTVTVDSSGKTATVGTGVEIFNDYRDATFSSFDYPTQGNVAVGNYSHAEGSCTVALGMYSHAEGDNTIAEGQCAHTEGYTTKAGFISHAEGFKTTASGDYAHAEGRDTTASGDNSHAEGYDCTASGTRSHAEGDTSTASGLCSHAEGGECVAKAGYSHAQNLATIAAKTGQTAMGISNVESKNNTDKLIIGKGSGDQRANCFRVADTATYATGNYSSTGADYAELFEWEDGNPDAEDRIGRFVSLHGEKISIADSDNEFILGIISGNPSVVGDVHDDQWQGMYLYDIYGRPLWEDVEVPNETIERQDPNNPDLMITEVIIPAHTERRQKLNPDYDNSQPYIARTERPEWACVGMMGKLVVIDDGTCQEDGCASVTVGGIATASLDRTKYRVLSRLDENHIRVLIL